MDCCVSLEYELGIVNAKLNAAYVYMRKCNQRLVEINEGAQNSWSSSNAEATSNELRRALDNFAILKTRKDNLLCLYTHAVWDSFDSREA